MPSDPATGHQPPTTSHQQPATNNQQPPAGYQPSLGRKLFMFGLCVAGLIFVWTYYYFAVRAH
jgi:hypothetical protein